MLTRSELDQFLREQGIDDVTQVRRCFVEADGQLSVIRVEPDDSGPRKRKEALA